MTAPEKKREEEKEPKINFWDRGDAKAKLGDKQGAIKDYTKAIKLDPKSSDSVSRPNPLVSDAYIRRGNEKVESVTAEYKDYLSAIDDYSKAVEFNPRNVLAYLQRASALIHPVFTDGPIPDCSLGSDEDESVEDMSVDDYEAAIEDVTKAIELDPQNAEAYLLRGTIKCNLEDFRGALADYTKASEFDAYKSWAYIERGRALIHIGENQAAIRDFTKAIEYGQQDSWAYRCRGDVRSILGDYQGAVEDYTRGIELSPKDSQGYCNRGSAKQKMNDLEGACQDWRAAAGLGLVEAINLIGKYCSQRR